MFAPMSMEQYERSRCKNVCHSHLCLAFSLLLHLAVKFLGLKLKLLK